jgi:CubicO group peptidase (beta-lactamase class C family)
MSRRYGGDVAHAIELVLRWPVDEVAAASVIDGEVTIVGSTDTRFPLASITKLLSALAFLVAVEEGTVGLDEDLASSLRLPGLAPLRSAELLSHASGLGPDTPARRLVREAERRIYSNVGYELAADAVARKSAMPFDRYVHEAVFAPLGMQSTTLEGSAASGATSTITDLVAFLREFHTPRLISTATHRMMVTARHPGLTGILPGFGRQADNAWGLGPEIRSNKSPHWTGIHNSAETYGHFGRAGSCLWWDPVARRGVIALTTRAFGDWAVEEWPRLADAVLTQ